MEIDAMEIINAYAEELKSQKHELIVKGVQIKKLEEKIQSLEAMKESAKESTPVEKE